MLSRIATVISFIACITLATSAQAVPIAVSNLAAHYDASVLTATGTSVTNWNNLGTGGTTLDALVVSSSPTQVSGVLNGLPVVRFLSGSSTHLRTGTLGTAIAQPVTIFHVGLVTSVSGNPYWYDGENATNRIAYLHRNSPSNNPDQFAGIEKSGGIAPVGSFNIWSTVYDSPAGSVMRLNGSTFLATGDVGPSLFDGLTIGARYTNGQRLDGDIAELAVVTGSINTAERQIIENHLSAKYDITLTSGDVYGGDAGGLDYDSDVFGIGQVDILNKVTSESLAGLGLEETGGTLDDGEFVLAGHKTTSNGLTAADMSPNNQRWQRVWYLDSNDGDVSATLGFDWSDSGLVSAFDASFDTLYYSPSDPFSFTALASASSVVGDQVFFTLASLPTGFYTLGTAVPEPSSFLLLGFGALGLTRHARRRRRRA